MKRKAGFLLIKGETYPYDIVVALGATREELLDYMGRKFVDALSDDDKKQLVMKGQGRTLELDNNAFILWTRDYPTKPEHFGYLAHEIFHTADLMLRRAGLTLSNDSDEAFAYHIDWITRRIFAAFKL